MKEPLMIRNEVPQDYKIVEELTKKAFWNVHYPGCSEHYIVHVIRSHEDFVAELDFVMELDGQIVGHIIYTKSKLIDQSGNEKAVLTFGPVSILPEFQRQGYGKELMEHSFQKARGLGYDVIVILGNPANYVSRGFKSCRKYNVSVSDGRFPASLLVKELEPGALDGRSWTYRESPVFYIDQADAERFDQSFEMMEKAYHPRQEEFYILFHSFQHEKPLF